MKKKINIKELKKKKFLMYSQCSFIKDFKIILKLRSYFEDLFIYIYILITFSDIFQY